MHLDLRVVSEFQENSYLIGCEETGQAALVDPGDEPDTIWQMVEASGLTVIKIINTHAHVDHVGAVVAMQEKTSAPFYLHPKDQFWLDHLEESCLMFSVTAPPTPTIDHEIEEGQVIEVGDLRLKVLYTPGHAEGHVSFYVEDESAVLSGDALFAGGIGRTDLPGGDFDTLIRSIREQLFVLPDETRVYPGHGPATTIGAERSTNPFLI